MAECVKECRKAFLSSMRPSVTVWNPEIYAMKLLTLLPIAFTSLVLTSQHASATQEEAPEPSVPSERSASHPEDDVMPRSMAAASMAGAITPQAAGPITPAGVQPTGALTGRVIYMSGGHGWQVNGSTWALQRPLLLDMNEDTGNVDQMTLFAYYCFNAGATVVPFRPVGNQTNEVVIDNDDPQVTWSGPWANSSSTVYFGSASDSIPYRFSDMASVETATATYTPTFPTTDFYPVYCWALAGNNRTNQLYKINHTGGQSLVRVPHHLVGGGWVYLGTYYFNAGSNAASGSVVTSNFGDHGIAMGVAVADAIRFGNGMGDVDEGGGVSDYPREDEGNVYWVQRSLGQGQPTSIYENGNVSSPIRMAAEMNNEGSGNMYKRAYVGFHSNATTGNTNTATARGVCGLWNNTALSGVETNSATPNQYDYALILGTEVKNDMVSIGSPPLEVAWGQTSGLTYYASFAYGEINNNRINNEFDATIVEVAFHDNVKDVLLLRDPKARNWIARAVCQGMVRYMNKYDGLALNFLPEPPYDVRAESMGYGIRVSWAQPVAQAGSGTPAGYVIYRSTDGYGFGQPVTVAGASASSLVVSNVVAGTDYYFRVAAYNSGGESMPSETVGCRMASNPLSSRILVVNAFTRFDRTLNLRQTLAAENYKPPGHDGNTGGTERVLPRRVNSFDYVVAHGKAITAASQMGFDSCQVRAVTNGVVALGNYQVVMWQAGNQSTNNRTFTLPAQQKIAAFRAGGGHLFVSGSDVAFDLGRQTGPTAADRQFLTNQLHGVLATDAQNNSGVHSFSAVSGSIFAGDSSGAFDDGSKGMYWVGAPDALTPVGAGASAVISYPGYSGGAAAVRYDGRAGNGKVVFFGFPFETITSTVARSAYMADILQDFSRVPEFTGTQVAGTSVEFTLTGEPGLEYRLESSVNLVNWSAGTSMVNTNGTMVFTQPVGTGPLFYRARTAGGG